MIFFVMAGLAIAAGIGGYFFFCIRRVEKFYGVDVRRKKIIAADLALAVVLALLCTQLFQTGAILILHLAAAFLAVDLAALAARLLHRKRADGKGYALWRKVYGCGVLPVAAAALIAAYGFFNMGHIRETRYQIQTDKLTEDVRVLLLTDVHYDTVQEPEVLQGKLEELSGTHPDLVILGGDIVEEGTSKEKMREVFRLLGGIESRYGVYYVYGNHDRQPYTRDRTYTDSELEQAIEAGGITILQDRRVEIGDEILLAGRDDAAGAGRAGAPARKRS